MKDLFVWTVDKIIDGVSLLLFLSPLILLAVLGIVLFT